MKDGIRVVLVDPVEASRQSLLQQLEAMESIWLTEVCVAYRIAAGRVCELRPNVTVVVADANPEQAAEVIASILREDGEAIVLAASHSNESQVVLGLVRSGAREVLSLPVASDELLRTIRHLTPCDDETSDEEAVGPKSKVIAITGASGEVGCTSLAVNLATTLARSSGQDVALADFELMFGGVDALLDLVPEYHLIDVVRSLDRIDLTLLKRMLSRHASGLYVLPRPVALQESAQLDADRLRQTLALLQIAFPCIVVDTSKSLQASDFVAFEAADTILVVVQLDPTSVRNTGKLLQCFREMDGFAERIRLVANRVGSLRSTIPLQKAEEVFQMPVSWQIPNSTKIFHSARDRGVALDIIAPRSDAQRIIAQIARDLVPSCQPKEVKPQRGFFRERFSREA